MVGIGIDIGSTAAKAAVLETDSAIALTCVMPTGIRRSMRPSAYAVSSPQPAMT